MLDTLGLSSDLKVHLHFEAYPVVAIQVGGGFAFSFGDRYFKDVNGDGRVDFVRPGDAGEHTVYFNVLIGGVPTFVDSSLATVLSTRSRCRSTLRPERTPTARSPRCRSCSSTRALASTPCVVGSRRTTATSRLPARWRSPKAAVHGDGAQVSIESAGSKAGSRISPKRVRARRRRDRHRSDGRAGVFFRVHVIRTQPVTSHMGPDGHLTRSVPARRGDPEPPAPTAALDANGRSQTRLHGIARLHPLRPHRCREPP